LNKKKI